MKFSFIPTAHAASLSEFYKPGAIIGGENATIGGFLSPLIQNLSFFFVGITFAVLLLSGLKFITAQGNPKGIQQAKDMLTYSIIGLVLSIAAYWITKIAFTAAGIPSLF